MHPNFHVDEKKQITTTPEYTPPSQSASTKRRRKRLQKEKQSFDSDEETSGFEDTPMKVSGNESTQDENDGNKEIKMKGVYERFYSTSAVEPISSPMQGNDGTSIDELISSSVQDTDDIAQLVNKPVSCSEGEKQEVVATETSDKSQMQMPDYIAALPAAVIESGNTFKAKQDRIDELEGELEDYKIKLMDADARLRELLEEKLSLQQQLNKESSNNDILRQKLLAKEEEESKLRNSISSLEKVLNEVKEKLARINKEHKVQMKNKDLEMENMKLRANEEKRKEMDELLKKCFKLEAKNELLEAERSRCTEASK